MIDVRDYMDRLCHEHGYEEREPEPECYSCVHFIDDECNNAYCNYEKRYTAEDRVKKYVHVGDLGRIGNELWSQYDIDHYEPMDGEYDSFMLESKWLKENTFKATITRPATSGRDFCRFLLEVGGLIRGNYGVEVLSTSKENGMCTVVMKIVIDDYIINEIDGVTFERWEDE